MGQFYFSTVMFVLLLLTADAIGNRQRWCCKSQAEYEKCIHLENYDRDRAVFPFDCVQAEGTEHCVNNITAGLADLMFLDGGDIYRYRENIVVVAAEDYGEGDASYYAVAVVKRNAPPALSMLNLDGWRSCHTGVGKTSGWNTPMGWIARHRNIIGHDGRIQLYNPFSKSCAPGANNPSYMDKLPGGVTAKWCDLCIGDKSGKHKCDRDNDERYYGYDGAFLCMKEGAGDVAFVKHTTVPLNETNDYSLLCVDGSRARPEDWRHCNLARVPAHGLVMRTSVSRETAQDMGRILIRAMREIPANLFLHFGNQRNLLWKSSTKRFIEGAPKSAMEFLGDEYYCNMEALEGAILPSECTP